MSDAPAVAKTPKKKVSKPKKPADHPKYSEMIQAAIKNLKERSGSSRQAILKYIVANYNVGKEEKKVNAHLKLALCAGVKSKSLKQTKGTGASGSFKVGEVKKAEKPKKKVAAKKKPAASKAKKPKKAATPKKAKKPAAPKKTGEKKVAKPKKAASPKKAAKKPAAKKPAAKKPAAKKPAQKKKAPAKKPAAKK